MNTWCRRFPTFLSAAIPLQKQMGEFRDKPLTISWGIHGQMLNYWSFQFVSNGTGILCWVIYDDPIQRYGPKTICIPLLYSCDWRAKTGTFAKIKGRWATNAITSLSLHSSDWCFSILTEFNPLKWPDILFAITVFKYRGHLWCTGQYTVLTL